jgi:hypothetical protein
MRQSKTKYEKLSAYLDEELSSQEVREIEEELKFSKELQDKLNELKRIKKLTVSSINRIPEAPYFETRLAANINNKGHLYEKIRRWIPAISFTALAVVLMVFLRFNPGVINELVEQQKTNLAGFYKENLKPLFFASDLSNEDVFNFAFSKQLPLDKTNGQYLKLGYAPNGKEFFEIKTSDTAPLPIDNLNRFISTLKLNNLQKKQVDSILSSYAEGLQTQVLVNDKNTIAINPNLWNYNKAIVADLMSFARNANETEFNKIVPAGYYKYDYPEVASVVKKIKESKDNNYIFFTPDTIFTEPYNFDMEKFRKEMEIAKKEMKKGLEEARKQMIDMKINFQLDSSFAKLKNDTSWDKNFNVYFDSNLCRVQLPHIVIPNIPMPDMDVIAKQVEEAMKNVTPMIIDVPGGKGKSYSFRYEYRDSSSTPVRIRIPDVDSILKSMGIFKGDSSLYNGKWKYFSPDSLTSRLNDSLMFFNKDEFKQEMKRVQKELERMREEMKRLRIEIHKDSLPNKDPNSIEI